MFFSLKTRIILKTALLVAAFVVFAKLTYAKTKVDNATLYKNYLCGAYSNSLGDLENAEFFYNQALAIDKDSIELNLMLSNVYIYSGNLLKARDSLRRVTELDPGIFSARLFLALVYNALGNNAAANSEYEKLLLILVDSHPDNIEYKHSLAQIYYNNGRLEQASDIFKDILAKDQKDYKANFFLGLIFEERDNLKTAVEYLKNAINYKPDFAQALNSLGYLYADCGENLEEAEELIKKALELDPENPFYLDSLGWVYYKRDNFEEAIFYLSKAAGLMSDKVIFNHLADVYHKSGKLDKATDYWQKSLNIDSKQNDIKEILNKVKVKLNENKN